MTVPAVFVAVAQKPIISKPKEENPLPATVVIDRISDPWTAGVLLRLSLIHISEPTRPLYISYAVFCLKKSPKSRCEAGAGG